MTRYQPFLYWLLWFAFAWTIALIGFDLAAQVASHWQMALAMLFGSYIGASTPMGGGAVSFPILVLLMDEAPAMGRSFSFLIQAVGMSSAAIYLFCRGQAIAGRLLIGAMLGSTLSLPLTCIYLLPVVSDAWIKMIFASTWLIFGVHSMLRCRQLLAQHGHDPVDSRSDLLIGMLAGLGGGVVTGLTGVGINMIVYMVLILIYRVDLRVAVATSVVIMAYDSLLGSLVSVSMGAFDPELIYYWFAASPVVVVGAPLGALMVQIIPRLVTLWGVGLLCVVQFVWTLRDCF